ncbi:hypothetical protein IG631_09710 [Alternaria alternata]|nr:hypothetical protein IG631_09710 [Alternaria alternata]
MNIVSQPSAQAAAPSLVQQTSIVATYRGFQYLVATKPRRPTSPPRAVSPVELNPKGGSDAFPFCWIQSLTSRDSDVSVQAKAESPSLEPHEPGWPDSWHQTLDLA